MFAFICKPLDRNENAEYNLSSMLLFRAFVTKTLGIYRLNRILWLNFGVRTIHSRFDKEWVEYIKKGVKILDRGAREFNMKDIVNGLLLEYEWRYISHLLLSLLKSHEKIPTLVLHSPI